VTGITLGVFENTLQAIISKSMREEITGGWKSYIMGVHYNLYILSNTARKTESRIMGMAYISTHKVDKKYLEILF
jgi:hypothetical protein